MNKIYFLRDFFSDYDKFHPYMDKIERFLQDERHGLNVEKLRTGASVSIFSMRLNGKKRLLFTLYRDGICLLDVDEKHKYESNRFIKNPGILKNLCARDCRSAPILEDESELHFPRHPGPISYQAIDHQGNKFLLFDFEQEAALGRMISCPNLLHGPAGSGKTAIALAFMLKVLRQSVDDSTSILYLCQSPALAENMRRLFPLDDPRLHAKTYNQLMLEEGILPEQVIGFPEFAEWAKMHRFLIDANILWKELRIRCGFADDSGYFALGQRQSAMSPAQRELVCKAYAAWQGQAHLFEPSFYPLKTTGEYTLVMVDEAQDFSFGQLESIYNFAQSRVIYMLGDHQVLYDGHSRMAFLQQMLFRHGHPCEPLMLKRSYRCAQQVAKVTNEAIRLKHHLIGGSLEKSESMMVIDADLPEGQVEWRDDIDCFDLYADTASPEFAIITLPEFLDAAKLKFATPLIFTPQSVKGLEFDKVLLWRLFEDKCLDELRPMLKTKPKLDLELHRAKSGHWQPKYLGLCNAWITAMSRAKKNLIIAETRHPRTRLLRCFLDLEHPLEAARVLPDLENSREIWLQRMLEFWEARAEEQMQIVAYTKLGFSPAELSAWKQAHIREGDTHPLFSSHQLIATMKTCRHRLSNLVHQPMWKHLMEVMPGTREFAFFWFDLLDQPWGLEIFTKLLQANLLPFSEHLWTPALLTKIAGLAEGESFLQLFLSHEMEIIQRSSSESSICQFFCEHWSFSHEGSYLRAILGQFTKHESNWLILIKTAPDLLQLILQDAIEYPLTMEERLGLNRLAKLVVEQGHLPLLTTLLPLGVDLSKPGISKLLTWLAYRSGHFHLLDFMGSKGAQLDILNDDGLSLAYYAVYDQDFVLFDILAKFRVNFSQILGNGQTPIHYCIASQPEFLDKIWSIKPFDLNLKTADGRNLIETATLYNQKLSLAFLWRKDPKLKPTLTSAIHVLQHKNLEILDNLIEYGLDKNDIWVDGLTLMHRAVLMDNLELIQAMSQRGFDFEHLDRFDARPSVLALRINSLKMLKFMQKELGCDLHRMNAREESFAHVCIRLGFSELLPWSRELGIDLDYCSKDGISALILAIEMHDFKAMHGLISSGADIFSTAAAGISPLMYAVQIEEFAAIEILMSHGAHRSARIIGTGSHPTILAIQKNMVPYFDLYQLYGGNQGAQFVFTLSRLQEFIHKIKYFIQDAYLSHARKFLDYLSASSHDLFVLSILDLASLSGHLDLYHSLSKAGFIHEKLYADFMEHIESKLTIFSMLSP